MGFYILRLCGYPHSGGDAGEQTIPPRRRLSASPAGGRPLPPSTHWLRQGVLTRGRSLPAHSIDSPAGVACGARRRRPPRQAALLGFLRIRGSWYAPVILFASSRHPFGLGISSANFLVRLRLYAVEFQG
uniref:Uncharacterized protein n=2 Tax=Oryza sativa subsp. japonica TaxID=39947 RepID=Q6YT56_ORYSJ|nr:P0483E09.8 [Oryza sativa Japonica Group]BAC84736.1 hypothetical protein [Oryza sativa Japonica Group]